MPLQKTNLVIKAAPLCEDFSGTPQDLYEAMIRRMEILSPSGGSFFVVGGAEPSSDVGPWLKDGRQWWIFDPTEGRYVPLDISASLPSLFFFQPDDPGTPGTGDPVIWVRTNQDRIVGIYGWTGSEWRASANITNNGPTAQRPTAPVDLEEFYDTDINVMLRYERGAWRTAAGSPGDVKSVTHLTLALAKQFNPGWDVLGKDDESQRGKFIGMAAKDPGATPVASFTTQSGVTPHAAGEQAGEERHVLNSVEHEQHVHEIGHSVALGQNQRAFLHRVDDGAVLAIPAPVPPNHYEMDGVGDNEPGTAGDGPAGTKLITAKQFSMTAAADLTVAAQSHENTPAALFLWTLFKL